MNKLSLILLLVELNAFAEPVNLANLGKNATGTSLGGGKFGLDVSLPPGAVTVSGGANTGSVFGNTDPGLVMLGVRKDSTGPLTGVADGDVTPMQFDANGALKTSQIGHAPVGGVRNDYTGTPVTTGAWVELVTSTATNISELEIFDSSGQTLEIGTGGSGSEVHLLYVVPGGQGRTPVAITAGTRISIRAVSNNASVGELVINLLN